MKNLVLGVGVNVGPKKGGSRSSSDDRFCDEDQGYLEEDAPTNGDRPRKRSGAETPDRSVDVTLRTYATSREIKAVPQNPARQSGPYPPLSSARIVPAEENSLYPFCLPATDLINAPSVGADNSAS